MQEKQFNPDEDILSSIKTIPVDPTELEQEENIMKDVEDMSPEELEKFKSELQNITDKLDAEDLDKRNYVKISPTFYIQSITKEEDEEEKLDDEGNPIELFKILNPETQEVETRELSDEEKKEILVHQLKESRIRFKNTVHKGNVTTTKFGAEYRKKRQRRNKMAKASRKANR